MSQASPERASNQKKKYFILLRYFVPPSFFEESDGQNLRRAKMLIYFSLVMSLLGPFFAIFDAISGSWKMALLNLCLMNVFLLIPYLLRRTRSLALVSHCLVGFMCAMIFTLSITSGGFSSPYLLGVVCVPIFAAFLGGVRVGLIWLVVAVAGPVLLYLLDGRVQWPKLMELTNTKLTTLSGIVAMIVASFILAYLYEEAKNQALAQLRESNQALDKAQQSAQAANVAKSDFLANMSHEIRTPLNAVIGYSEMLQEEAEELGFDAMSPDLLKINNAGKHLLSLINDILDLSKIEAGKMEVFAEDFDLLALLEEVRETLIPQAKKNDNELISIIDGPLSKAYTDQTKLRQVLINLLSNGCKFTHQGKVTLKAIPFSQKSEEWIRFEVRDTGIGIEPEKLETLFEPFSQGDSSTTKKYGGTGLGLTISKNFCALMGGRIWVESQVGKGSEFFVELPLSFSARPSKEDSQSSLPQARTGLLPEGPNAKHTLLVIDDEPNTLDLMTRFLTKQGFQVIACSSGQEGLRIAKQLNPTAILLDVLMPDMDGWTVLAELKADASLHDIPVIMHTILDEAKKGYSLGASEFMLKPINPERLTKILKKYRRSEAKEPLSIMIVDDDENARELLSHILEKEGCRSIAAENGEVALQALQEQTPSLILLDLVMPQMDGFAFLEELRKKDAYKGLPVIVITSKDLSQQEQSKLHSATQKILQKGGYNIDELLQEIQSQLQSHNLPSPDVRPPL